MVENNVFLYIWYETDFDKISFNSHDSDETIKLNKKCFPYKNWIL